MFVHLNNVHLSKSLALVKLHSRELDKYLSEELLGKDDYLVLMLGELKE